MLYSLPLIIVHFINHVHHIIKQFELSSVQLPLGSGLIWKSNNSTARVHFHITNAISNQNCTQFSSITTLLHQFRNHIIKSLFFKPKLLGTKVTIHHTMAFFAFHVPEISLITSPILETWLFLVFLSHCLGKKCNLWVNSSAETESQSDCEDHQWFLKKM